MKYYWHIYKTLVLLNFSALIQYRVNFTNSLISNAAWGLFHFISILLLTSRSGNILNWKREEIILLTGVFSIFWGIFHVVFSKNLQRMSRLMDRGELDGYLLKPIDSQFILSVSLINFSGMFRVLFGVVALIYISSVFTFDVSLLTVIGFILFLICGLMLIYSIWFITLTLTIWFAGLSNLVDLLFHVSGIMRYPPEIFRTLNQFVVLFLLPLLLLVSTPTRLLLHKVNSTDAVILMICTVIFFFISREFWKFALRHYSSASG